MSASKHHFPILQHVIERKEEAETRASEDAEAEAELDEADFTERSKEQSRLNSERLAQMAAESSGGRIRATAYLDVSLKAAEKRKKRATKYKSMKLSKGNDAKKLKKAADSLFFIKQTPYKTPVVYHQKSSFAPVSVQAFTTPSPNGTAQFEIENYNITTPSISSVASPPSVDSNFTCRGCGHNRTHCHEAKYRNFCLHAVLDYFELVGMDFSTQHGITNAFTMAYTSAVKRDMLERHQFYERSKELSLPDCIEQGALQDALYLRSSRRLLQFLLSKRVYDIPNHLQDVNDGTTEHRFFPDNEQE